MLSKLGLTLGMAIPLLGLLGVESQAAIPPSEYIVRKAAARRAGLSWLKLSGTLQASLKEEGEGLESPTGFLKLKTLTLVDLNERVLHIRLQDESGAVLFEGLRPLKRQKGLPNFSFGSWLLEPSPEALVSELQRAGIPILTQSQLAEDYKTEAERQNAEKTRLSRIDGRVAWVIGKEATPAAWFEKDTFVPMRFELEGTEVRKVLNLKNVKLLQDAPLPRQWVLSLERTNKGDLRPQSTSQPVVLLKEDLSEASILTAELAQQSLKTLQGEGYTPAADSLSAQARAAIDRYLEFFR